MLSSGATNVFALRCIASDSTCSFKRYSHIASFVAEEYSLVAFPISCFQCVCLGVDIGGLDQPWGGVGWGGVDAGVVALVAFFLLN